jgi:hypothetical protein
MKTARIVAILLCVLATPLALIECFFKGEKPTVIIINMWTIMMLRAKMTKFKK